ncbi:MAG: hypothetical protein WCP87_04135 [Atribacterota bacterium]|nr:hypothetical protein [Candidatus Atribacteria bacterium]
MLRATTIRIPENRLRLLKAIAGYENKSLSKIFNQMAEEYITRGQETLELLNIPEFVKECREGLEEIKAGKGKDLLELDG